MTRPSNDNSFLSAFRGSGLRYAPKHTLRRISNSIKYGQYAPRPGQTIYVDPNSITKRYIPSDENGAPRINQSHTGLVLDGDWDTFVKDVKASKKYEACVDHFVNGVSWEETGILDLIASRIAKYGHFDGCSTREEIEERYAALDRLYEQAARAGRFLSYTEIDGSATVTHKRIFGHMNRDGRVIRHFSGNHRFAIARILNFPTIPIYIGAVHLEAVRSGAFARLSRQRPH